MAFTTQIFLFIVFPFSIIGVVICRWLEQCFSLFKHCRLVDIALAGISLGFYGWACFDGIYQLLFYALIVYAAGRLINAAQSRHLILPLYQEHKKKVRIYHHISISFLILWLAILLALFILFRYKYWNFVISLWNNIFQGNIQAISYSAPLGISFITFSAVSYLIDIHRGLAPAKSFLDCLLYLSFFPKVVSGPIIFWRDFQPQIARRQTDIDDIIAGLERIITGFAKKLILADMFGASIATIEQSAAGSGIDAVSAWWTVLLYMLQIYYDFAGYSDIAIGIGRLLGFHFQANFDFPYRSRSITEFWRRWHISLGAWFREYVYIPLGGSRHEMRQTLINLAVVFFLTGIWHGAGWNYILWGGINAFFVIIERIIWNKRWYQRIPEVLKWSGTMLVVALFWELFRFQSLRDLEDWMAVALGIVHNPERTFSWRYFLDCRSVFLVITGLLGATILGGKHIRQITEHFSKTYLGFALREIVLLVIFILSLLCMVNSAYSPFIYFQY